MTAPNRNTLWAAVLVDELSACGVEAVCLSPGSRSTPLTVAFANHADIETFSHLDERSSAFFALGRARRTGTPTALVCTSGTAAANFHPAILEASESRVPLIALTADRPPELRDSGANQTTDQLKLYGDAVRWFKDLPKPEPDDRKLRSLRVTAARAVGAASGMPAGPVHLNVPFRKPLEPTPVEGDIPTNFATEAPLAVNGRDGPFVETTRGRQTVDTADRDRLAATLADTTRGLIVCGPADSPTPSRESLAALAGATGFPVLADPLSGHRFSPTVDTAPLCGGYDSYLDDTDWPAPEVVLRFGGSPTSKTLRKYLADIETRQFIVDPAGQWPEAEFTATDLVVADPSHLAESLADTVDNSTTAYRDRFAAAERRYWDLVDAARSEQLFEGGVVASVAENAPDNGTLFVSNSMPIRDLDRFGRPRAIPLTVLGNRGVSGIDGIISTALGAGSATATPLVVVTGDLAYYHDMNGLLALSRVGVDATIVLIDNDGGGIFHKLPIEAFDPPFTAEFRTPHGLDFELTGDLYGLEFCRTPDEASFVSAFQKSLDRDGTQVLSVEVDGESSHRFRERLHERVQSEIQ
ncbi:2-succinyl-5-enolpyruvyl-6-hydroxy-3-cyclohexene-1-carboxylic-acid synthase [Halovenus rubra]|uniref:2-succinyl-5-enolpyruvyl-6-hydroxy-3-cyclohexene-1-carboxylic-acid synthase n=2 Tax=Halovenus rubra TaxID=869890 RepID=A0ACC7DXZ3_9EURY|nr:2-succinyl-5-enolpyruvyl-6-hydroxy-3-cyclohexene-1-carboxylic-acid synthase [Halovenus rubra]